MKNITYINAGAGSGKTFTLTDTLCNLLKNGQCGVSEIIMTTFTEMAAADLRYETRKKLIKNNQYQDAAQLQNANIGTVHSIAFKYIQRYWYKLGISASVSVIDDDQKRDYVKSTFSSVATEDDIRFFIDYANTFKLNLPGTNKKDYDFWQSSLQEMIDKATAFDIKDMSESKAKTLALAKDLFGTDGYLAFVKSNDQNTKEETELRAMYYECIERLFSIYEKWNELYTQYKKKRNAIEFNDMENMFLVLLDDDEVRADISSSIKYVFVDEFQDSSPKQIRIFDRLSELVEHSYWVGDPKQAIYGFRACDITLVQAVMSHIVKNKNTGGFEYENLGTSYRSVGSLVENTNNVFSQVFSGMADVKLKVHRTEETPTPSLLHWDARKDDGVNAKGEIKLKCDAADAAGAIAAKIRKMLKGQSAPCQVFEDGQLRKIKASDIAILALNNSHVGDIASALRAQDIPVATEYAIDGSHAEIQLVSLLLNYLLHSDADLLRAEIAHLYKDIPTEDILKGEMPDLSDLEKLKTSLKGLPIASIVRQLVLRLDLMHFCGRWGNVAERQNNLTALITHVEQYDDACIQRGIAASIDGYIAKLNADMAVDSIYCKDGVHVLTYHKSKGLQWPVVIMCSLGSDSQITEKGLVKSYTNKVNALRISQPTAENIYSDYYLLCMPPYITGNTNPQDYIVETLRNNSEFVDYMDRQIGEKQRLMYVGATRARDYLITISKKGGKLKLLTSLGIDSTIEKDKTTKDISLLQNIWGANANGVEVELIMPEEYVPSVEKEYPILVKDGHQRTEQPKYLQPSKVDNQPLVDSVQVRALYPAQGQQVPRIAYSGNDDYDIMGTCIHNFMAVYDPLLSEEENVAKAQRIVEAFHLSDELPQPADIVTAAARLYQWLEQQYGKPCKVAHEVPFRDVIGHSANEQIVNGEIDLLWYTSADECVLIDFKSYPGAISHVIDKEDPHYAGKYAPQLHLYKSVLERHNIKVKSVLIYYAVMGCVLAFENMTD